MRVAASPARWAQRRIRRAVWALAVASALQTTAAFAQQDEAVARFERGVQLYEAEHYDGALVEFNTAYKLSKNYRLLYNVGIVQTALKDYAAAADTFNKYLSDGGADISEPRKADVRERLAKLALMITRVRIETDAPPGSTLLVDEQPVGTVPLPDSIAVKIGRRQFTISHQGRTATKTLDVSSGEHVPVVLSLKGLPAPAPVARAEAPKAPAVDEPSFPWPWWGLTAVLGGAAAITGALAVDAHNDFKEKRATFGVDKTSLQDDNDKAQTLGVVTDSLLIGTAISGILSSYLTVRYLGSKKRGNTAVTVLPTGIGYWRSF
jgi:hypothetical protein